MNRPFYHKMCDDIHTQYMACSQSIDWDISGFDLHTTNGYVVQNVSLTQEIDKRTKSVNYYEAWKFCNGNCPKQDYQTSHDLFCIGHPLDSRDALIRSIGHAGKVVFNACVYWVDAETEANLCKLISQWPTNEVHEANGLHAVYSNDVLAEKFKQLKQYNRPTFQHPWDFTNRQDIYTVVLEYCKKMFRPNKEIDRENFQTFIDDCFPNNTYLDLMREIVDAWSKSL